jgi:hypothetical protein
MNAQVVPDDVESQNSCKLLNLLRQLVEFAALQGAKIQKW